MYMQIQERIYIRIIRSYQAMEGEWGEGGGNEQIKRALYNI